MRIYVGFITYGESTAKYLPYFLPSLEAQTFKDLKILAIDNTEEEDNKNSRYLKNYPEIDFKWAGGNLGFARAYNKMINEALAGGAKYFLALNPDMAAEADMAEKLVKVMERDDKAGAVMPKILKWDFANKTKTDRIDSLGLAVNRGFRFFDKRQGEIDDGKMKEAEEVFGFTGAAVLLRLSVLKDVAYEGKEFFDELMFMYKEDCDLSLRLRLGGWKIFLEPNAVVCHDRTASAPESGVWRIVKSRLKKERRIKKWSFLNQMILFSKYKKLPLSFYSKSAIFFHCLKRILFALFFEPYLIKELFKFRGMRKEIKKRRDQLKIRVNIREFEKFMK